MRSSSKPEKRTYTDLLIILVILAAVLAWFFWPSAHRKPTSEDSRPQELALNVMPLAPRDVSLTQSYIGYVTPIHSVDIVPYINGFLEDIMVDGGQRVERGDNLILIRQNEYKASLEAAEASVLQADATLNNAAVYYRRMKQAGTKVISKTELDNAKASYLSAKAALAQAKANRDLAKVNFDYTIIQAPISGIVGNVDLTRGDYVSPSSGTLLKIIQFDPIRVVFPLPTKITSTKWPNNRAGCLTAKQSKSASVTARFIIRPENSGSWTMKSTVLPIQSLFMPILKTKIILWSPMLMLTFCWRKI